MATHCCCSGNIPANLLNYVNSFDVTDAEFACSVRTDSGAIRVTLTWTYPERRSRHERSKTASLPIGEVPSSNRDFFHENATGDVGEEEKPRCGEELGEHSGDESTVSVSSLDSCGTCEGAQRRRSSRLNSVATDTEEDTPTLAETVDRRLAESGEAQIAGDFVSQESLAVPQFPHCSNGSCKITISGSPADRRDPKTNTTSSVSMPLALSPINEVATSNNESDSDTTTTEDTYDVTGDVAALGDDVSKAASSSGNKVSVGVFYLNPPRTKTPPEEDRSMDFVKTSDSRQAEILADNRAPVLGAFAGYSYQRVTEKHLMKLYKENMEQLLVVRASKYRLSQKQLEKSLIKSGKIDSSHVTDVFYDEIVMARPAYVIQFKEEFSEDIINLTTVGAKCDRGVFKLSEDNEVTMSRPQPKMMEPKRRTEFKFP